MSAFGPKRTSVSAPHMSAFGGKADMTVCVCLLLRSLLGVKRTWVGALHMSAFDPKRTCPLQLAKRSRYDALASGEQMRRRDFITLSGAAVVAGTLDVRAQQSPRPVIGFLRVTSAADATNLVAAFRQGLNDAGFIDGQNIAVEYRWADGHSDRLPALAADLINRQVAVIIGHSTAAVAAKAITTTVPIVAVVGDDPVHTGLVANLNRPGGNVTGVTFTTIEVSGKRLSLLSELVPD